MLRKSLDTFLTAKTYVHGSLHLQILDDRRVPILFLKSVYHHSLHARQALSRSPSPDLQCCTHTHTQPQHHSLLGVRGDVRWAGTMGSGMGRCVCGGGGGGGGGGDKKGRGIARVTRRLYCCAGSSSTLNCGSCIFYKVVDQYRPRSCNRRKVWQSAWAVLTITWWGGGGGG